MEYLFNQLESRQDFELTQGYMALFLKVQYMQYMQVMLGISLVIIDLLHCMFVSDTIGVLRRCQAVPKPIINLALTFSHHGG